MTKITATIEALGITLENVATVETIRDAVDATDSLDAAEQCVADLLRQGTDWHVYRGGHHIAVHHRDVRVLLVGEYEQTVEKTYHLLNDLGVYKSLLKKNFHDNDRGPEDDATLALLEKRTQTYTVAELDLLLAWLWTSADDCIDGNPDEENPLQVYTSRQKIKNGKRVLKNFAKLTGREAPVFGDDD